jgi:hypothetical protein
MRKDLKLVAAEEGLENVNEGQ